MKIDFAIQALKSMPENTTITEVTVKGHYNANGAKTPLSITINTGDDSESPVPGATDTIGKTYLKS